MVKEMCFDNLPEAVGLLIEKVESLEKMLMEKPVHHQPTQTKQLLTVREAAEFLSLAVPTVYSMVSRGDLPHMKRSKRLYFDREELMSYLKQGRQQTNDEVRESALDCLTKKRRG